MYDNVWQCSTMQDNVVLVQVWAPQEKSKRWGLCKSNWAISQQWQTLEVMGWKLSGWEETFQPVSDGTGQSLNGSDRKLGWGGFYSLTQWTVRTIPDFASKMAAKMHVFFLTEKLILSQKRCNSFLKTNNPPPPPQKLRIVSTSVS